MRKEGEIIPEQSTYSFADFLRKVVSAFARKGSKVECVQTANGFEFANRFLRVYPEFCVNVLRECKQQKLV